MTVSPTHALLEMLERREQVARMSYEEVSRRISEDEQTSSTGGIPAMSDEEMATERMERRRASSRWTEAQEALAEARRTVDGQHALDVTLELLTTAATIGRNEAQSCGTRGEVTDLIRGRMGGQIAAYLN